MSKTSKTTRRHKNKETEVTPTPKSLTQLVAYLRSLCDGATPAPWTVTEHGGKQEWHLDAVGSHWYGLATVYGSVDDPAEGQRIGRTHSALIAATRNNLPVLLDETEKLLSRLALIKGIATKGRAATSVASLQKALAAISKAAD